MLTSMDADGDDALGGIFYGIADEIVEDCREGVGVEIGEDVWLLGFETDLETLARSELLEPHSGRADSLGQVAVRDGETTGAHLGLGELSNLLNQVA